MSEPPAAIPPILAVNDDPEMLDLFELILARANYTMVKALSGQEALAICRTQAVALVMLDIMMPGMDGFSVYAALRSDEALAHIPILIVARLGEQFMDKIHQLGIKDYLDLPCAPRALLDKIQYVIG